MKSSLVTRELLSALADDQLSQESCPGLLDACRHDESALACWNTYHLIGDLLRLPAGLPGAASEEAGFVQRLGKRLASEQVAAAAPAQAEPAPELALPPVPAPVAAQRQYPAQASNDSSFRWKLVAGVASLTAVAAIAWSTSGLLTPSALPQLAQASLPQILVASPQGAVVRDARLEELLTAHRQFGTATALQESSGFLRNAAFDVPRDTLSGSGR